MLFSNALIASLAGSLAGAAPVAEGSGLLLGAAGPVPLEAREGPPQATHCNDMVEQHVTLVEQVTGWTFPVSGAGCNAGSTSKFVLI